MIVKNGYTVSCKHDYGLRLTDDCHQKVQKRECYVQHRGNFQYNGPDLLIRLTLLHFNLTALVLIFRELENVVRLGL